MLLTVALTAMLAQSPASAPAKVMVQQDARRAPATCVLQTPKHLATPSRDLAVDLHPMTEEERKLYPGRERFDKTEWYESQFKSAKIVTMPEHVDEWNNGGVDAA